MSTSEGGPKSVVVVGGGVFGAAAGLTLAQRGHRVRLLDPGPLPHPLASSTDISKVIRMDYGADVFYMDLMERALDGWRRWNRDWPRPLFHETGFLLLTRGPMQPGEFEYESFRLLNERGHAPIRLTDADLRERFPVWAEGGYDDGYFNPEAGWAESGQVVARLIELAIQAGVEVQPGVPVTAMIERAGRVAGIELGGGETVQAETVVVAAGAWTPSLLPWLSNRMWAVGQPVLHFKIDPSERFTPPKFVPWAADISRTGWYGFPVLEDGTLKIANHGPGLRFDPDAERRVSPDAEPMFRQFLSASLPALAGAPLAGSRVCLYCDTWDGDFYLAADPERPGLVVASGGSGHGFKFAPVLGDLIADAVEGRPNPDLARFGWRAPGRRSHEQARHSGDGQAESS
jgi:glycine/D-amino acid oxidase-like deaminating enzyme